MDIEGFGESYVHAIALYDGMSPTELYEHEIVLLHDKPVGKLKISRVHGESWIYGFVVSASYRGQRIGSAVLRQVIDRETAAGCHHLKLEVALTNPDTMKLYTTAGFQITSAQDYYKYLR
ncbi:putative acetyltransferase [compost metagenome]